MNPTPTSASDNNNSLFQNGFESKAEKDNTEPVEITEPIGDLVTHTQEHKNEIKNSWTEFYSLKTEDISRITPEKPVTRIEIQETRVETVYTPKVERAEQNVDTKPYYLIDTQKGSGSWLEDAGFKLNFKGLFGVFGSFAKSLFGAMNIFKEISFDTGKLLYTSFKKEKPAPDPKKAEKEAEKKLKRRTNIQAFFQGLQAQMAGRVSVEAVRMETQEKENINKTIKLTNTAYKGIKDSSGRLTVYAASMYEREQLEQEKQYRKIEKQQKAAPAGPDLSLDKAAEGGFLSSTGGQGAG